MEKYIVKIDDNYHSSMEDSVREVDSFETLEEAIEKCKQITIKSLEDLYEEGITPEKLSANWAMFGEDPFIYTGKGDIPFSAREFITDKLCKDIIKKNEI